MRKNWKPEGKDLLTELEQRSKLAEQQAIQRARKLGVFKPGLITAELNQLSDAEEQRRIAEYNRPRTNEELQAEKRAALDRLGRPDLVEPPATRLTPTQRRLMEDQEKI